MGLTFWTDRSVFVTGATGLLGSWLVEELLKRGANVVCLLRDWTYGNRLVSSGCLHRCNVVGGELEAYGIVERVLNEYEVDSVFHLGAQTIVGTAERSPLSTFESNIKGTWCLLEACRRSRLVERILVASSDKAYGSHSQLPYTEDTPLQGRAPYDVSKSCADLLATCYFDTYGVPLAITRCGNLYGGGDLNFNRLIPGTIRSLLRAERPVVRSDGLLVRDYFYVADAVLAYLSLAERLPDAQVLGQGFNFGTEMPLSVLDVVGAITAQMGRTDLAPEVLGEATHEIREQYLDCAKARRVLGWRPRYSLQDGLRHTIDWYRQWLDAEEPPSSTTGPSVVSMSEGSRPKADGG